jgi:hypothetical protein
MNFRSFIIIPGIILAIPNIAFSQLVKVEEFPPRRADTIILERNWRTRDRIILSELEFEIGDTVTPESLSLSLKKIWNLQNFASVAYRWDTLSGRRSALILVARDALTVNPVIGGRMQLPDLTVKAGIADRNFLGRNIRLEVRGQYSSEEPLFGEIRMTIPRQLLWKNMSAGASVRREDIRIDQVISDQAFISIVNPFHQDYHFTFTPDLETGIIRHKSVPAFEFQRDSLPRINRSFWFFRLTESVGTVTHRRHQEEGFNITAMIGAGIGLHTDTRSYFQSSIRTEYHHLISPQLQLSILWRSVFTTTAYESFWTRYGPGQIRGIEYGELTGPLMQLASAGCYYTWLNRDYLAVEQSVFVQFASAWPAAGDWFEIKRHYAIGTGFQFTIPMYPAASILISFSFNPGTNNWFYLEL